MRITERKIVRVIFRPIRIDDNLCRRGTNLEIQEEVKEHR